MYLFDSFLIYKYSDITNCEVVTAWASGCSWNEAVELSGSSPGDLVRVLSRVLDAVRQLGNLPFQPVRVDDDWGCHKLQSTSPGIHPDIRRLCREAAKALNRYPVKDPLAFDTDEEIEDDLFEDEETDENTPDQKLADEAV